jgi:hypothetical protein
LRQRGWVINWPLNSIQCRGWEWWSHISISWSSWCNASLIKQRENFLLPFMSYAEVIPTCITDLSILNYQWEKSYSVELCINWMKQTDIHPKYGWGFITTNFSLPSNTRYCTCSTT